MNNMIRPISRAEEQRRLKKLEKEARMEEEILQVITIPPLCKNCKFFEEVNSYGGVCHKYAPRPMVIKDPSEATSDINVVFPFMQREDWCGEYILDQNVFEKAPRTLSDGVLYVGGKIE